MRQARYLAEGGFHAAACFHSQQAGEKAVKAVHFYRGCTRRRRSQHSEANRVTRATCFCSRCAHRRRSRARSHVHPFPVSERPR
ncbi:MAG: hypothetical protein DMF58_06820 [Acidobacteria bacterium]|nr:MAG: hypothetical protein DMF58_06820 [Acidobacteriota bacterium]